MNAPMTKTDEIILFLHNTPEYPGNKTSLIKMINISLDKLSTAIRELVKLGVIKYETIDGRSRRPYLTNKGEILAEQIQLYYQSWAEVLNNDS